MRKAEAFYLYEELRKQADSLGINLSITFSCFLITGHCRNECLYLKSIKEVLGFVHGYGYARGKYPDGKSISSEPFVQGN